MSGRFRLILEQYRGLVSVVRQSFAAVEANPTQANHATLHFNQWALWGFLGKLSQDDRDRIELEERPCTA